MSDIFDDTVTFEDLGLRSSVVKGVKEAGFEHPTHIQASVIRAALDGHDIIGQAKTGTGKTAAFGLPLLHLCDKAIAMQGLVLVPTRELAVQVCQELETLGKYTPIRTTCIIGGHSMREQAQSIKQGGHLMVGTPGRVMDMNGRREISFKNVRFVVLDEVDRMLDIGFRDEIRKILEKIKQPHQTLFVSATISEEIDRLARKFTRKDQTQRITAVSSSLTVSLVDQKYLPVEPWDKKALLLHLLRHEEPDTTVVFCRTKATVQRVTRYLQDKKINARQIHGDLAQVKRNRVIKSMRKGTLDVLIASDLAARGLDIEHISHVINYDLPDDPEMYVHRIGRTARAGRKGIAWSFVTSDQGQLLTEIEKLTGTLIEKMEYPDFKPGPLPADVKEQRKREQVDRKSLSETMAQRAQAKSVNDLESEELEKLFPGGVIPKGEPRRTLGSRFRTRRRR